MGTESFMKISISKSLKVRFSGSFVRNDAGTNSVDEELSSKYTEALDVTVGSELKFYFLYQKFFKFYSKTLGIP